MNRRRRSNRTYARTDRVSELLREILGDELERIEDDRIEWVSITTVDVNPELSYATVFYSSLSGPEGDEEILEALEEHRKRLQGAIARQARIRRTPELSFMPDAGVRSGARVEEILRTLDDVPNEGDPPVPSSASDGDVPDDDARGRGEPDGDVPESDADGRADGGEDAEGGEAESTVGDAPRTPDA
jgi:ribosome-binding factor A